MILVEEPDLSLKSKENKHAREIILERLHGQHGKLEAKFYKMLDRGRSFGLLLQIPFAPNSSELTGEQADALEKAMAHPSIKRLRDDPTIGLLVLGYSDSVKQDQFDLSLARAKLVAKTMREGANVQNLILPLGLGACPTLGPGNSERDYVGQVWVIIP